MVLRCVVVMVIVLLLVAAPGEALMFQQGGGLEKQEESESSRFKEGRTLATIVGKPPALCYLALQLFKDNKDAAMNLLFDNGAVCVRGMACMAWAR